LSLSLTNALLYLSTRCLSDLQSDPPPEPSAPLCVHDDDDDDSDPDVDVVKNKWRVDRREKMEEEWDAIRNREDICQIKLKILFKL
jgi:hypothetical protein